MNILGINSNVGASICLVQDGKVVFALQEERLTRKKNQGGLPIESLKYIETHYNDIIQSLDYIALCDEAGTVVQYEDLLKRYHQRFENTSVLPNTRPSILQRIKSRLTKPTASEDARIAEIKAILSSVDLKNTKFQHVRHHLCHAAAAYYGLAKAYERPYLVLTLDGGGDKECATIYLGEKGRLRQVASTPSGNSIGNIYSLITYLLGLKPHEHEYKLMGLAPYVPSQFGKASHDVILKYLSLDEHNGLVFKRSTPEKTTWIGTKLRDDLRYMRFDSIASGLQQATETLVLQWVKNAIQSTGIHDLLLSGGVFMNVKLNQRIAELDEVNSVNVFPSCGDESNAFGAAFYTYAQNTNDTISLPLLQSYATGPNPSFDLESAKSKYKNECRFEQLDNPNQTIADLLAKGEIVARCAGPMEFGARALGNRSLLADPKNPEVIDKINFMIKQRDFWMPFAPAILAEDVGEYLRIPNALRQGSPYMMFSFETTERHHDMLAAIHRADKTARAQIVNRELYPDFHDILTHFKALTGRSVVLNTSFNLHGHPIVTGTEEAIHVLLNSNLEYLIIEDTLITKQQQQK
ncbi:carbamoyltransferase C-terminal domain-containing protein [Candidiatus Paracoxiella cheracis]|uniref:carbamoyltransferase C-terminal domain-containing protein n=1 Tax=Candidiatus Paracoxiella cheracis TaxID=3405120 RepID=UPI003BF4A8D8